MIRALRSRIARADWRRFVGFAALVAFALVVLIGAAHVGGDHCDGDEHLDDCGTCHALALIGTSETFVAPQLVGVSGDVVAVVTAAPRVVLEFEFARSHAPRGPPSLA